MPRTIGQTARRWLLVATGLGLLVGIGIVVLDYSLAKAAHQAWRPDPLGLRIERFVRGDFTLKQLFGTDRATTACLAILRERRLTNSSYRSRISTGDSSALLNPPCSFIPQLKPEFQYSVSYVRVFALTATVSVFLAVCLVGFALTYRHVGWRRLSTSLGVVCTAAITLRQWYNGTDGIDATLTGLAIGLILTSAILAARECALWIRRGFADEHNQSSFEHVPVTDSSEVCGRCEKRVTFVDGVREPECPDCGWSRSSGLEFARKRVATERRLQSTRRLKTVGWATLGLLWLLGVTISPRLRATAEESFYGMLGLGIILAVPFAIWLAYIWLNSDAKK